MERWGGLGFHSPTDVCGSQSIPRKGPQRSSRRILVLLLLLRFHPNRASPPDFREQRGCMWRVGDRGPPLGAEAPRRSSQGRALASWAWKHPSDFRWWGPGKSEPEGEKVWIYFQFCHQPMMSPWVQPGAQDKALGQGLTWSLDVLCLIFPSS